jgi:hypothetical protein
LHRAGRCIYRLGIQKFLHLRGQIRGAEVSIVVREQRVKVGSDRKRMLDTAFQYIIREVKFGAQFGEYLLAVVGACAFPLQGDVFDAFEGWTGLTDQR